MGLVCCYGTLQGMRLGWWRERLQGLGGKKSRLGSLGSLGAVVDDGMTVCRLNGSGLEWSKGLKIELNWMDWTELNWTELNWISRDEFLFPFSLFSFFFLTSLSFISIIHHLSIKKKEDFPGWTDIVVREEKEKEKENCDDGKSTLVRRWSPRPGRRTGRKEEEREEKEPGWKGWVVHTRYCN